MVYIGPVNTLSLTAKTKAISGYTTEQNMPVHKQVDSTVHVAPEHDRRRQQDRRKHPRAPVLETRQGDRRKNGKPHVDISV